MDKRLLHYYERELRYIRELAAGFAHAFPKVALRLGIEAHACTDPHVERLLEGHALLSARVQQRLDGEFGGFTQALLEQVDPSQVGSTPSVVIVQFVPDAKQGSLDRGYLVPAGSTLRARSHERGDAPCEFRTAHPVRLWPIVVESAQYTAVLRDIADLRFPTRAPIQALLRLRLRTLGGRSFGQLGISSLPLFLQAGDEASGRLFETLVAHTSALISRWSVQGRDYSAQSGTAQPVRMLGLEDTHALLPCGTRSLRGHRLLREYFALPARFQFIELCGLAEATRECNADVLDVILPLSHYEPSLEGALEPDRFVLHASPAINLFPQTCDTLLIPRANEPTLLVPNHARPLDFEVHSVQQVTASIPGSVHRRELHPLRQLRTQSEIEGASHKYVLERRTRVVPHEERQLNSTSAQFPGHDVFITLIAPSGRADQTVPAQLRVQTLCTNRDLPMRLQLGGMANGFNMPSGAPVQAIRCMVGPTAPRSHAADGANMWSLISHMSRSHLDVGAPQIGGEALRELLALYSQLGDPQLQREVDGIRSVESSSLIRPLPLPGPRQFARGLEMRLVCEEQAFAAHRTFMLAAVLSEFFAGYASVHSFTETVLHTSERGEVYRWEPVAGRRGAL